MGKNSETCQDPDKIIFNFSIYNLNDHVAIPPKAIEYSEFLLPFKMLFREITSLDIGNFDKECVKSRLQYRACSHHLSIFPRYLTKVFPDRKLKHWIA